MSEVTVIKRDGTRAPIDYSKINTVAINACLGLKDVSASELIEKAKILFVDGVTTEHIQALLIETAASLITLKTPDWSYVCARLNVYDIRKRAYGSFEVPHLKLCIMKGVELGYYDRVLLDAYTDQEIEMFQQAIDHSRDYDFTAAAMGQLGDKYLLRNRAGGHRDFYESPQVAYMLIAMTLFSVFPSSEKRNQRLIGFYNGATTFKFSLPTPIMAGARTPTRQFSSCVLIKCGDTLKSINATAAAVVEYVSKRAGIGIDASEIRAEGSPIRKGEMVHTGVVPFLKYHVGALKSCSQGGIRGGSATVYYAWWHYQFEDIIVLKNNRGVEENRERRTDYGIQINGELIKRYLKGEDVWLLDPRDVPDMYAAFFADQPLFSKLYAENCARAERGEIRGRRLSAESVITQIAQQRSETGRIYIAFVDNINRQGAFNPEIDPVTQSNLCFTGDTMIATADGTNMVSIADLALRQQEGKGYLVYSARERKIKNTGQGHKHWKAEIRGAVAVKTGTMPVVKVMLSNGDTFRCTPNHLLATPEGHWVSAEHSVGVELEGFFTSYFENKYRRINSVHNDHANQHRMIWEYLHGKKPEGKHIDHIVDDGGDFIENLRLVDAADNFAKKSEAMKANNAMHKVRDKERWLRNVSIRSTLEGNGRFKGLTNLDLFNMVLAEYQRSGVMPSHGEMVKLDERFPSSFSKNRFGGKFKNLVEMVKTGVYSPEYDPEELEIDYAPTFGLEEAPSNPYVVAVVPDGVEDVYDLHVQDNHNFYIITNKDPLNSRGVLVHNCLEIALPTKAFESETDTNGRVALCTLASFNMAEVTTLEDLMEVAESLVWALNGLLRFQDYPVLQAKLATEDFATLGVGVVNLAAALAARGMKYGDENSLKFANQYFEKAAYALTRASVDFAKEFGPCKRWADTCYGQGIFPHEKASKQLSNLADMNRRLDPLWEELRADIAKYGIANATLMAIAPTESSSQVLNATNGIEPPMEPVSIKASKSGLFKQVIPYPHLAHQYNYALSTKTRDYLTLMAVIQRWVDQAISSNTTYNPEEFEGNKIPISLVVEDIIDFYVNGGKTLYYSKVKDGAGEESDAVAVETKPQEPDDSICESCVI